MSPMHALHMKWCMYIVSTVGHSHNHCQMFSLQTTPGTFLSCERSLLQWSCFPLEIQCISISHARPYLCRKRSKSLRLHARDMFRQEVARTRSSKVLKCTETTLSDVFTGTSALNEYLALCLFRHLRIFPCACCCVSRYVTNKCHMIEQHACVTQSPNHVFIDSRPMCGSVPYT